MRDISSRFIEALEGVCVRVRLWSVGAGSALYSTLSCLFASRSTLLAALLTETYSLLFELRLFNCSIFSLVLLGSCASLFSF